MESEVKFKVGDIVAMKDGSPLFRSPCGTDYFTGVIEGVGCRLVHLRLADDEAGWFSELGLLTKVGQKKPDPADDKGVSLSDFQAAKASKAPSGGSNDYYKVQVTSPTTPDNPPYQAECNDIIEALGMDFMLGNIFKACWRIAALRKGQGKQGNTEKYDAEKIVFFAKRILSKHG